MPVKVPCGQCVGCRLERSRQWAIRCHHEASLHRDNSFITLTYAEEHLPAGRSLDKEAFQKFMKRLRKRFEGRRIRYFHCGEYGARFQRPHYHACLFGLDFEDKKLWKVTNDVPLYTSETLQELWPFGFSTVGDVTFQSAAYVARYIMKKITGEEAAEHYAGREPEYTTMSRRPGIGRGWLEKYRDDVYPQDFVVVRGSKMRPPKYYDRIMETEHPVMYREIRGKRVQGAKAHSEDNGSRRLRVREVVQEKRITLLKRSYEDDL